MSGVWVTVFRKVMKKIWIVVFLFSSGDVSVSTAWRETMAVGNSTQTGRYLYQTTECEKMFQLQSELPVKMKIIKDDEGNRQVKELTSSEEIEQAIELFVQIRVGEETDIYVTDKYHSISLFFDDGEKVVFSLNGDSLEYRKNGKTELYQLENIEQFWKEVMI